MTAFICLKCKKVFYYQGGAGECCGQVEKFSPDIHSKLLIPSSNAWSRLYESWKDHPVYIETAAELVKDGNFSACSVFCEMIKRFVEKTF